jgi:hypothetical protein
MMKAVLKGWQFAHLSSYKGLWHAHICAAAHQPAKRAKALRQ